eukprot:4047044-Pleurochrysis_carterae.AAC.4
MSRVEAELARAEAGGGGEGTPSALTRGPRVRKSRWAQAEAHRDAKVERGAGQRPDCQADKRGGGDGRIADGSKEKLGGEKADAAPAA